MPMRKALVVGIDDYRDNPLHSCVNDATDVAEMLEMKEYGFNVTRLLDGAATRRQILSELNNLFAGKADFTLFYFAGHGTRTSLSTFLVTSDTDPIDIGIDLDHLRKLVQTATSDDTTVVLLLDCCHSGAAGTRCKPLIDSREIKNNDIERHLVTLGSGKVVLDACQPDQVAFEEPSLSHGVFTYYLLEGLYGEAADAEGKITIPNLYDHVSRRFEKATRSGCKTS